MKNKIILVFTVLAGLLKGQAEFVPVIDRATGSFTSIGPGLANVTWVYPDERTFNENTGTYIFLCSQTDRLISVDVSTGSVVTSPTIASISKLQFNKLSNKLHGLQQVNANNTKNFLVIDPATAAYTVIGNPLPGSSLFQGCFSAMDNVNNVYTFLDPNNTLYSLNALTGVVVTSPTLALSPGQFIYNMEFDNSTGQLYGILRDNPTSTSYLCLINRQTGVVTTIGPGSPVGAGSGSGAIDESAQQYMFLSSVGYSLTTFNMATGSPVFNSVVSAPNCINFSSLKYDNVQAKLYCIYWGTTSPVYPPPQPGAISGAGIICSGASQVYSVLAVSNATSYTWALPGGWNGISTTNSILVTVNSASGTLSVSANNQGGSSITQTLNIVVNNPPASLSQVGAALYSSPGNTYQWVDCNNNYSLVASGSSSYAPAQSGSYAVLISVNGCTAISNCNSVFIAPPQPTPIFGSTVVCEGSTQVFSVLAVPNATSYSWTLPSGWFGTSTSNSIAVTINAVSGSLSVTANNQGGASLPQQLSITVNTVNATITQTANVLYASSAGNYQWIDCNNSFSVISTGSNSFAPVQSGNYGVIVTANGCIDTSLCQQINLSPVGMGSNATNLINLFIYPSPNNGSFKLQMDADVKNGRLLIINTLGQHVFEQKMQGGENVVQAPELLGGLYSYVLFNNGQKIKDGKLIVEK